MTGHGDHAHGLAHGQAHGDGAPAGRLRLAFGLTALILGVEVVGGLWTGSVALLADAGHMLSDAGALAIALLAARISTQPATARRSFGYGRVEILAALANGVLLGGVSVGVALESIERLRGEPPEVAAGGMLGVALVGLAANLVSAGLLARHAAHNLNVRGAFLHVMGDALGSLAATGAAVLILVWGIRDADAIAGLLIAVLVIASAVHLIRESVDVLLEAAPRHLDLEQIAAEVAQLPGVSGIHDLHVWTVSSGFPAMSAHIDLQPGADPEQVRQATHRLLHQTYEIEHTTIQTEQAREPELLEIQPPPRG